MRIFQSIPKDEKRFLCFFRALLIPVFFFSLLLCTIGAIAAASGEKAIFVNGQAVMGWRGVLVAFSCLFWMVPCFTLTAAFAFWLDRRISPLLRKKFSRLLFWRRP